jgi:hypothetical protein
LPTSNSPTPPQKPRAAQPNNRFARPPTKMVDQALPQVQDVLQFASTQILQQHERTRTELTEYYNNTFVIKKISIL